MMADFMNPRLLWMVFVAPAVAWWTGQVVQAGGDIVEVVQVVATVDVRSTDGWSGTYVHTDLLFVVETPGDSGMPATRVTWSLTDIFDLVIWHAAHGDTVVAVPAQPRRE